jgi:hypothetical protein
MTAFKLTMLQSYIPAIGHRKPRDMDFREILLQSGPCGN